MLRSLKTFQPGCFGCGTQCWINRICVGVESGWFACRDTFGQDKTIPGHVTLIALLVCVGLVILIKVVGGAKQLLRGGMPSGHSAVAFAVWMAIWMLTSNSLISILVFLMALLIARSRMANGIHSLWEVLAGSALGALTTLLVFQILL